MAQLQLKNLLGKLNGLLEKSNCFFGFTLIKKIEIKSLIDEIANCIPADIKEAELIISKRDEIIKEAQNSAERIIQDAKNEQSRLINDNEIVRRAQDAVSEQKQQVEQYCDNLQNTAIKNAEDIRTQAIRQAANIQEGAQDYAAKVFDNIDSSLSQTLNNVQELIENVRVCKKVLNEQRLNQQADNQTISDN